jgi:hypothetical protein
MDEQPFPLTLRSTHKPKLGAVLYLRPEFRASERLLPASK